MPRSPFFINRIPARGSNTQNVNDMKPFFWSSLCLWYFLIFHCTYIRSQAVYNECMQSSWRVPPDATIWQRRIYTHVGSELWLGRIFFQFTRYLAVNGSTIVESLFASKYKMYLQLLYGYGSLVQKKLISHYFFVEQLSAIKNVMWICCHYTVRYWSPQSISKLTYNSCTNF